ncbi:496_t:CDS:1, partial [Acaulospora morrowiae]
PNPKGPNLSFMWTPPDNDVGPISFVGTIVQSGQAGFQIIKVPTNFTVAGSKVTGPSTSGG